MKWQYKTIKFSAAGFLGGQVDEQYIEDTLNAYGVQGWELVSVFCAARAYGRTQTIVAVLKRPIE